MFARHFGLASDPFGADLPTAASFQGEQAAWLRGELRGVLQNRGVVLLTGSDGVGKSTLLRVLAEDLRLAGHRVVAKTCGGVLSTADMLRGLANHPAGGATMLLVDDAGQLGDEALRRLLGGLAGDKARGHAGILFAGPPALEVRFDKALPRQLPPDRVVRQRLAPLHLHEVGPYIESRVEAAGNRGSSLFTADAVARIAHESQGVPRRINALCGNGLFLAFLKSQPAVSVEHVVRASGGKTDPAPRSGDDAANASNGKTGAASPRGRSEGRAGPKSETREEAPDASPGIAAMLAALRAKPAPADAPGAPDATGPDAGKVSNPAADPPAMKPLAPIAEAVATASEATPAEKSVASSIAPAAPVSRQPSIGDAEHAPRSEPTAVVIPMARSRRRNPFVHRPKRPIAPMPVSAPVRSPPLPAFTGEDRVSLHGAPPSRLDRQNRSYARAAIPIGIAAVAAGAFILVGLQRIGDRDNPLTEWIVATPSVTVGEPAPPPPTVASEDPGEPASPVAASPIETAPDMPSGMPPIRIATAGPLPGEPEFRPPVKPLAPMTHSPADAAVASTAIDPVRGAMYVAAANGAVPPNPAPAEGTQTQTEASSTTQLAAAEEDAAAVAHPIASAPDGERSTTTSEESLVPPEPVPVHAESSTLASLPKAEIAGSAPPPMPEPSGGAVRVLGTLPAPVKVLPPGKPQVSARFLTPPADTGAGIDCHALSPEQLQRTAEEGQCVEAFLSYVMATTVSSELATNPSYLGSIEPAAGP